MSGQHFTKNQLLFFSVTSSGGTQSNVYFVVFLSLTGIYCTENMEIVKTSRIIFLEHRKRLKRLILYITNLNIMDFLQKHILFQACFSRRQPNICSSVFS